MDLSENTDILILGAGLSASLLALRLHEERPDLKVRLVDRREGPSREHTWSFHQTDLTPSQWSLLTPFASGVWGSQEVRFKSFTKRLQTPYASVRSRDFFKKLPAQVLSQIEWGVEVTKVSCQEVLTKEGIPYRAKCIIDARGKSFHRGPRGYQKFFGLDLKLSSPHGLDCPLLMDARVSQTDGFRFFYVLPWSESELFIEDTYYSDSSEIDESESQSAMMEYASLQGWSIEEITSHERGVIEIPFEKEIFYQEGVVQLGTRSGASHLTTGYSLPQSFKTIDYIVSQLPCSTTELVKKVDAWRAIHGHRNESFQLFLNRLLFLCTKPYERVGVFEFFYRKKRSFIERFYAGKLSLWDKARMFMGKPPIPPARLFKLLGLRNRYHGRQEWARPVKG